MEISHSRVWGEKNFGAQYPGNTPGESVRIKSKMFDIFGLARQIPLCVRPSWSRELNAHVLIIPTPAPHSIARLKVI